MAKSQAKQGNKKKNTLNNELLKESSSSLTSFLQNTESFVIPEIEKPEINYSKGNAGGTSNKKKKKKKKKTPSESEASLPDNESNSCQPIDLNAPEDVLPELSNLREITVIKLPPPVQLDANEVENKQTEIVNDTPATTNTSKKKKKKQKKAADNNSENKQKTSEDVQTKQDTSLSNTSAVPCSLPNTPVTTNASYFKVSQSHNSTVLLVSNPSENANKDNLVQKITDKTPTTITMGPGAQCFIKNPDHMNLQNHLLEQMGQNILPQHPAAQPSNFVSLTSIVNGVPTNVSKDMQSNMLNMTTNVSSCSEATAATVPEKTKAQLKAERRAIQEAQRAAKEASRRASNIIENHGM